LSDELKEKLGQLHERRNARETIKLLPEELREDIDLDQLTYRDKVHSNHGLKLFPNGVSGKYVYPEGYSTYEYIEVDRLPHLAIKIENSNLMFDSECLVSIGSNSAYWFLKKEQVKKLIAWYLKFSEKGFKSLVIFQVDFKRGVVVDNYCGYLPKHLITNTNEVVYEYIRWERI
jgi:hypothetical protein